MTKEIKKARARLEEIRKKAEEEVVQAEVELLLGPYFDRIKNAYISGSKEGKEDIMGEVERVSIFDRGIAKRVRLDTRLTGKEVAHIIGSHKSYSSRYETGTLRVNFPPKGEHEIKYLEFLKERGYNPFDL